MPADFILPDLVYEFFYSRRRIKIISQNISLWTRNIPTK